MITANNMEYRFMAILPFLKTVLNPAGAVLVPITVQTTSTTMKSTLRLFVFALLIFSLCSGARAQGTAFTYQGVLNDRGSGASGIFDFQFTLFDSTNLPGNVVAGPVTNSATGVSNGLFIATLDFGTNVFTGGPRWLQLGVRTNGGAAFMVLVPRQQINTAPYAITARDVTGSLPADQLVGTIQSERIADGSIHSNHIAIGNIHSNLLAIGAIHSNHIAAGSIHSNLLAIGAIHSNHLAIGSVHSNALALGSVTAFALADDSVNSNHLAAGSVHSNALIAGSVTAFALANDSVHSNHLAVGSIHSNALALGSVGFAQLSSGAALANLNAAGYSAIPAGGMVMSSSINDSNLLTASFSKLGKVDLGDVWEQRAASGAPVGRNAHTAVWTGTEVIIWGGLDTAGCKVGGGLNQAANSSTPTPTTGGRTVGRSQNTAGSR